MVAAATAWSCTAACPAARGRRRGCRRARRECANAAASNTPEQGPTSTVCVSTPASIAEEPARPAHAESPAGRRALLAAGLATAGLATGAQRPQRTAWSDARFADVMDRGMRDYEALVAPVKADVLAAAVGGAGSGGDVGSVDVVEVGIGAAPSMAHYAQLGVRSVLGIEPNAAMAPLAMASAERAGMDGRLEVRGGVAESLPLDTNSADVLVATMVLCSVTDVEAALAEFARVLRPGGRYAFVEHVAAPPGSVLRCAQTLFDPAQVMCACGCHLNRDPLAALRAEDGFNKVHARRFSLGERWQEGSWADLDAGVEAPLVARPGAGGGAGWSPAEGAPGPHYLLSPHLAGVAIAR